MICPFKRAERPVGLLETWTCELLVPVRVFDLFCPARLHSMNIGVFPVMLDDQEGVQLYSRQPVRITLGSPAQPGQLVRLDLAGLNEGDPPFMVLQFLRAPDLLRRRGHSSRRPRVLVIR